MRDVEVSLGIADMTSVGLLRVWLFRFLLGCMDSHLDRTQTRSRYWRRCTQGLPHLRCLDHLPLVPVPNRLGTVGGW